MLIVVSYKNKKQIPILTLAVMENWTTLIYNIKERDSKI